MRFLQVKDLLCSTLRLLNLPGTISYSTQSHCPLECTSQFLQLSIGEDDWIQQKRGKRVTSLGRLKRVPEMLRM